ncbi:hypothetical protein B0T13DRAFT_200059 [Neurospora crassa]|nr:hypothetical protein B0T13DRAFT_200059 [Neurospora crassa]
MYWVPCHQPGPALPSPWLACFRRCFAASAGASTCSLPLCWRLCKFCAAHYQNPTGGPFTPPCASLRRKQRGPGRPLASPAATRG